MRDFRALMAAAIALGLAPQAPAIRRREGKPLAKSTDDLPRSKPKRAKVKAARKQRQRHA